MVEEKSTFCLNSPIDLGEFSNHVLNALNDSVGLFSSEYLMPSLNNFTTFVSSKISTLIEMSTFKAL